MTTLALWIGCGLALAIGAGLNPRSCDPGIVSCGVGVTLAALAAVPASSALRWRRAAWVLAVLAVMLARGLLAAANDDPSQWRGARGRAAGLRTLRVEQASHPGPRCRARVRSAGVALWLDAPPSACPLAAGQRVRVPASDLVPRVHPAIPGEPSPTAQARSHGAVARARVDTLWPAGGDPHPYWGWVAEQRQRAWTLSRGDEPVAFVVASTLGVRSALSPGARSDLRRAGLGHLVAVSGLHVGLAAWAFLALAMRLGARLGGGTTLGVVLSWGPLLGYVLLTGASPPAVRAGVMAIGVGLGGLCGRPHHGPVLLAATCVAMLVVRPAWAFDPGFQLSAAAMAALVRAPAGEGMLRQTWRVTWAVLPFSLWHFGHAGLLGLVCNLVAVPVFTLWVLPLGLVGWLLVPWWGVDALRPAAWGARPILELAGVVADWPAPPGWMIGSAAALAVVVGLVVGRRDRAGRLRSWGPWLPPLPIAIAVVAAVSWPRDTPAPPGQWWAVGHPNAPAVVTTTHHGERSIACLHAVSLSASRWRGVLDALGVDAAGMAEGPPHAPHEVALAEALQRSRRWVEQPARCPRPPPEALVADVLRECRRRAATHHAMAVVGDDGMHCFVQGAWAGPWPLPRDPDLLDSPPLRGPG